MSNLLCQAYFMGRLNPEFCTRIQALAIASDPQSDINLAPFKNPLTSQLKNSIKLLTRFLNISLYLTKTVEDEMAIPNEFNISTRIVYGRESAALIGEIAGGLNLKNIQLVTDKGVANSGTLDFLLKPLKDAGINSIIFLRPTSVPPARVFFFTENIHFTELRLETMKIGVRTFKSHVFFSL